MPLDDAHSWVMHLMEGTGICGVAHWQSLPGTVRLLLSPIPILKELFTPTRIQALALATM